MADNIDPQPDENLANNEAADDVGSPTNNAEGQTGQNPIFGQNEEATSGKKQMDELGEGLMGATTNINFLLDVPLDVAVELGRAKIAVKDMLQLGPGSVIELDRLIGEPVDLLVNNRLIAKGEVVVFDENFGIRITDISNPEDKVRGLE